MTKRDTSLWGHSISEEMLNRLNNIIGFVNLVTSLSPEALAETAQVLNTPEARLIIPNVEEVITYATATVIGSGVESAILHVEMICHNATYTPATIDCPLPGSEVSTGVNKAYANLPSHEQSAIKAFFSAVAQTLQFNGNNLSIEESQPFAA